MSSEPLNRGYSLVHPSAGMCPSAGGVQRPDPQKLIIHSRPPRHGALHPSEPGCVQNPQKQPSLGWVDWNSPLLPLLNLTDHTGGVSPIGKRAQWSSKSGHPSPKISLPTRAFSAKSWFGNSLENVPILQHSGTQGKKRWQERERKGSAGGPIYIRKPAVVFHRY